MNEILPEDSAASQFALHSYAAADSMNILETLGHGAVAAVVDAGTSIFNSIPFHGEDASTADLLSRVDENALQVYNEHPDAVQAASFIGGMVLPIGISSKIMTGLRAGSKGVSWFSEAGRVSRLAEVESAFAAGLGEAKAVKNAQNIYYAAKAANMVADVVAAEVAINITMNAHPWMEDYQKDFARNFALNVALGGGIGAALGHIVSRAEVTAIKMGVEKELFGILKTSVVTPSVTENAGKQFMSRTATLENIEGHLAAIEEGTLQVSTRTKEALLAVKQAEGAGLVLDFQKVASGEISSLPMEFQKKIISLVSNPEFAQMDEIKFLKLTEAVELPSAAKPGILKSSWDFLAEKVSPKTAEVEIAKNDGVYSPVFKSFMSVKESGNYATLADIGKTVEQLQKEALKEGRIGVLARNNMGMDMLVDNTAFIQEDKAIAFLKLNGMSLKELQKAKLVSAPDDLSTLQAIQSRLSVLRNEGQDADSIKILLTSKTTKGTETIEITGKDLSQHLGTETNKAIKLLKAEGMSEESIALRTGVPLDTLRNAPQVIEQGVGLTHLDSISKIEQALLPENRALHVSTSLSKFRPINTSAAINKMQIDNLTAGTLAYYVKTSPSDFVRKMGERLIGDEFSTNARFLEKGLDSISLSGVGWTMTRSANSVVEKLGSFGTMLTSVGKQIVDIKNIAKDTFTKPLSESLAKIAANDLSRIELNTALNVVAGMSDMKVFKGGKFWSPVGSKLSFQELNSMDLDSFLAHAMEVGKDGKVGLTAAKFAGKEYTVVQPEVVAALEQIQTAGREIYHLRNTYNETVGIGKLVDTGFWNPANNPVGKEIAYIFNKETQTTSMMMASSLDDLLQGVRDFKAGLGDKLKFHDVVMKGDDQKYYNILAGRHDPLYMGVADVTKRHSGASASAVVDTSNKLLADIVQGYDYHIDRGIERLAQLQLEPVLHHLENASVLARYGHTEQAAHKLVDPGVVLKNILMGKSNLMEHPGWEKFQNGFQVMSDATLKAVSTMLSPFMGNSNRTADDWIKLSAEMEAKGIINPFQVLEKFSEKYSVDLAAGAKTFIDQGGLARETLTPRLIALSNATAATTMLRVAELAQPLVNILSLPILSAGAVGRKLDKEFMGAALSPKASFNVAEALYDGVRLQNHPVLGVNLTKLAEKAHLFKQDWRDVNGIMKHVRGLEPSLTSKAEELLDSNLVKLLSKPADWSEEFVRRQAFFTGAAMAKKAYPGLSDAGVMTFARKFLDDAVGNYAAAQRPAMFQGTVGMAMGLFQTYMLTMGQLMYRGIETKNWKMLSSMLLTQQGIFGTASLPGFHPISDAIGTHFSDDHVDIQTGMFRAVGDTSASLILYGLPSQLVGVNTRGDIQPRVPNPMNAMDTIAAVNMTKQAYDALGRVIHAAGSADRNTGKAMLEALSLQSISRPVARVSELLSGHSITSKGNVIDKDTVFHEGAIDWLGIGGRVMATRPLAEIKAREAEHLNSLYGSYDADKRQALTNELKSKILNGNLTEASLSELGNEYFRRGGKPTGWRSATNTAIMQANQPGTTTVRNALRPDAPYQSMVNDLD